MAGEGDAMPKPGLTACLIVRDERRNLEQLLPTLIHELDDVVIVDTGSTDGGDLLARGLGARLFPRAWDDHFSNARNRGLDEVKTSHVIWIDADDRISGRDLQRIREAALRHPDVAWMLRLESGSPNPAFASTCDQLRVFPSHRKHRFEGRVNERIRPALEATGTGIRTLDVPVRHLGYATEEGIARKCRRNLELCRVEWAEGGPGAARAYHYAKAAAMCGESDEAARIARECVDGPVEAGAEDIVQNLRVTLGRLEGELGRPRESLRRYRAAVQAVPADPFARLHLGESLRKSGDLDEAIEHLQAARDLPPYGTFVAVPESGLRRSIREELGRALETAKRFAEAADVFGEAVRADPGDVPMRIHRARTLASAGARNDARAMFLALLGQLDAQLKRNGPDGRILACMGECYAGLAEPDAARLAFEQALRVSPGLPAAVQGRERVRDSGREDRS
jgi:tetratricopeptide (TPR) repeat protein